MLGIKDADCTQSEFLSYNYKLNTNLTTNLRLALVSGKYEFKEIVDTKKLFK